MAPNEIQTPAERQHRAVICAPTQTKRGQARYGAGVNQVAAVTMPLPFFCLVILPLLLKALRLLLSVGQK